MDADNLRDDDQVMSILVFLLMALFLFAAARRWGADTRASRQWEWDPPQAGAIGSPHAR